MMNICVYGLPVTVSEKSDEVLDHVSHVHIISSVMKLNSQYHKMNVVTVSLYVMLAMQNSYTADWGKYSQFYSDIFTVYLLEQCSFFQLYNLIAVISSVFVCAFETR
jgi:hypothetical protein